MNQAKITTQETRHDMDEGGIGLVDLLIVMAKHKKLIICFPAAVAVASAALSLGLPNFYKASTKLLPPQQSQSGAAALLSQLGGVAGMAAGASGIKSPNELYVSMLKSRTIADRMVSRFDLKQVYDTPSAEIARSQLAGNTVIASGKDGLITIEVEDKDKKLVAPLANGYVDELLRLTKVLAVTEAAQRRLFFERQLEQAKNKLVGAEAALKGALGASGVISVDGESAAVVTTLAQLRARISAKEIELGSMHAFVTPNHPEYRRAEEVLSSLRAELSRLENGSGALQADAPATKRSGGLENIQRLRDLKYYQMLYELLAKQYEAARLDEARDSSVVQVLDPAFEPERKSRPQRALMVVLSTFAAFVAAALLAFVREARQKALARPAAAVRWNELRSYLRVRAK
jgi:uncharacterized protein involved in exopolysaccharide biosynthesis